MLYTFTVLSESILQTIRTLRLLGAPMIQHSFLITNAFFVYDFSIDVVEAHSLLSRHIKFLRLDCSE